MSPETLVEAARSSGCPSIAYTYSEPLVHIEFILEAMRLAHRSGLWNVLVTNGCIEAEAAREVLALTDAANVDLKCWSADAYRDLLGGDFTAVLEFIRLAAAACHLEITTLVVPDLSDSPEDIDAIASFIAGLSPDIPFHLSAYRPAWRHRSPPTEPGLLESLARRARERLRYVYIGNVSGEGADTRCPSCGALVVRRRGYDTDASGLSSKSVGRFGVCVACAATLPIIVR
jgi:pyruvate formate lyase activating enzyme